MKTRTHLALLSFLGVCTFAQPPAPPQLKLRIIPDKDVFRVDERVMVRVEFTNLTKKTLCFPTPDPDCRNSQNGSVVTTGESVHGGGEQYICFLDGGGAGGAKLDAEVRNDWIKLPPNAVYLTKAAEAHVTSKEIGDWRLNASYHPPEPAFDPDYKRVLQSAAESAGCTLPDSSARAQPRIISAVRPATQSR